MILEHEAVKYYWENNNEKYMCQNMINVDSFIGIMQKEELVYLHTGSIVKFCHKSLPDKFKDLTRSSLCKAFPNYRVISSNGTSHGFRVITKEQFNEIIGG